MSLLSKSQNSNLSAALSPAIQKSGDLRLPASFTKLSQQYIEDEFASKQIGGLAHETQMLTMADSAMHPTIALGAMLEVDEYCQPKHNDIVVARYFGEVICRRIFISKRKSWLYGDDKDYKFIDLSRNHEVKILGVVTSHHISHNAA